MKEKSNNLVLFNVWGTKKGVVYKYVGYGNGYGTNPTRLFSLGNLQKLLDKNPNAVEILKDKLKSFTRNDDMEVVKSALLQSLETENILKTSRIFGVDLIYKFLNKHEFKNLFDNTKQLNSYEIFSFLVSKRIIDPSSIFNSFNEKDEYLNDIKSSKNAFYRTLDVVYKNSDKLLEHLRLMVEKELKEKTNEIYYDTSTIYFETFTRNGIKHPGYSKDGKFKEDQIVIALACDKYGIPYHFKLFKGNTIDSKTLIPFFIEIERKYGARNITVVRTEGDSTAANIRFLEKKGYKFIISYRAKTGGNEFKDYITDEKDYIQIDSEYKYKSFSFVSTYKKKRADFNHLRLKFITHSNKRRKKRQRRTANFNR
ncbi:transposase [Mycoplasmopsis felis]|nr:transposase [Mycoplasmopsis felis]UWV79018.1 transposase [Mycoplasmopsis felis]